LVPQVAAPASRHVPAGSGPPSATSVQSPIVVGSAHDLQTLLHGVAQQTPCAQLADEHSLRSPQNAPFGLRPHEFALQTFPDEQLSSIVQAPKQRVPLHANGAQGTASGATQAPLAVQTEAGV
jgi:hypothetical protein